MVNPQTKGACLSIVEQKRIIAQWMEKNLLPALLSVSQLQLGNAIAIFTISMTSNLSTIFSSITCE
jgi:hypothetical protein